MTVFDFILLIVIAIGLFRGYHIGFVRQIGSTLGFLGGLGLSSVFIPLVTPHLVGATSKTMTTFVILVSCIVLCMLLGEVAANRVRTVLSKPWIHKTDHIIGAALSGATLLLITWLAGSFWLFGPPSKWQDRIQDSTIYHTLSTRLPEPTAILKKANSLIETRKTQTVFEAAEPSPSTRYTAPTINTFASVRDKTANALVKVQGFGCGGLATGTGFFIQPNLIATNAHVIAGVAHPKVIDKNHRLYNAQPVLFNTVYDFAILRLSRSVVANPLTIDFTPQQPKTPLYLPGFPGGGPYTEKTGVLIENIHAAGKDIYGRPSKSRNVLSMQSHIEHGNSGGPVINTRGEVVGVVFATSTAYNNIGYALANEQLTQDILRAPSAKPITIPNICSQE